MSATRDGVAPWRFGEPLGVSEMARLRREMALEGFKWDPRVGDQETLCDRALYLQRSAWLELSDFAERLDREALAAEQEIAGRPSLIRELSLPRAITRRLVRAGSRASGPRVSRYDFHWTSDGWKVSEVNSDVPGGYVEASGFSRRFAEAVGESASLPGDPGAALAESLASHRCGCGPIAMVHATAYSDDAQVMHYLAEVVRAHGCEVRLVGPEALFDGSGAMAVLRRVSGVVRFFPAEWLPLLGRRSGWRRYAKSAGS